VPADQLPEPNMPPIRPADAESDCVSASPAGCVTGHSTAPAFSERSGQGSPGGVTGDPPHAASKRAGKTRRSLDVGRIWTSGVGGEAEPCCKVAGFEKDGNTMTARNDRQVPQLPIRRALVLDRTGRAAYPGEVYSNLDDFLEALSLAPPDAVALIEPFTRSGRVRWEARRVLSAAGVVPVVATVDLSASSVAGLRELLDQGLSDWIDLGVERTPAAMAPRLAGAVGRPLKQRIDPALPPHLSHNARTLLFAAVDAVTRHGGAGHLAASLGVTERTVSGWCVREGLPPPRRLHAWLRLLLASALLESAQRTVLLAARAAGYANEQSLRRAIRQFIGAAEASSPRTCTFHGVVQAFVAELGELRDRRRAGHGRGRPLG
jgi:hypothetical protein